MLETARRELRETITQGTAAGDIDAAVQQAVAGTGCDEEQRSSLWLYAWLRTGNGDQVTSANPAPESDLAVR